MFGFGCDKSRRPRRGFTAALALSGVVACSLGVALPTAVVKRDGAPYPCQHHACGCIDAEHCWRDCCCMSQSEKLAWARSNGVKPPAYVVAAAQREAREAGQLAASEALAAPKHACCAHHYDSDCAHEHSAAANESTHDSSGVVLMVLALRCRGVSASVALLPPALPVSLGAGLPSEASCFDPAPSAPLLYESPVQTVTSPPPRTAQA